MQKKTNKTQFQQNKYRYRFGFCLQNMAMTIFTYGVKTRAPDE